MVRQCCAGRDERLIEKLNPSQTTDERRAGHNRLLIRTTGHCVGSNDIFSISKRYQSGSLPRASIDSGEFRSRNRQMLYSWQRRGHTVPASVQLHDTTRQSLSFPLTSRATVGEWRKRGQKSGASHDHFRPLSQFGRRKDEQSSMARFQ